MLIVLLAQVSAGESAVLPWWRLERDGQLLEQGESSLQVLRDRFPGERLRVLVAPAMVSLYRVQVPARRAAVVRAALPFALEDQLSQELDELHIVAGPRRADGSLAAVVVEHRLMEQWQAQLAAAGWRAELLLPLSALYEQREPEQGLVLMPADWPGLPEGVLVLSADQEPVLVESSLLAFWLQRRLADLEPERRQLCLCGLQAEMLGTLDPQWTVLTEPTPLPERQTLLARCLGNQQPFNLLNGPYAASMAAPPWRKLRPPLIAAATVVALLVVQLGLEWWSLSRERERLWLEVDRLFSATLPNTPQSDPVFQFLQVLEGRSDATNGQASLGPLLHDALTAISSVGKARIRQVRSNGEEVEIELQVASFAELESIRAELSANPRLLESLQGADSGSEGVTARLRIQRRAS